MASSPHGRLVVALAENVVSIVSSPFTALSFWLVTSSVDLVAIRRASHLHSQYEALAEGQTGERYASAIADHSNFSLSMAPCIEGLEGVFVGWCGSYDAVNTQPGIGIKLLKHQNFSGS
jgi:hypothetical protein